MLTLSESGNNAEYILQAKTKAVVFTHIDLTPKEIEREGRGECVKKYTRLFERYLRCRNVGLVYMYLSLGAEEIMQAIVDGGKGQPLVVPPNVLEEENECLYVLQSAENKARRTYPDRLMKFIHVTTPQLITLFENLHKIDPGLFSFLFGTLSKSFTYDSPKFVEAVIRIARGQDPRSAKYPIIRFDEDVEVCEKPLDRLLAAYEEFLAENDNLYFFFSGCYGDPDNPDSFDPVNDRAVRTHWFSEKNGDIFKTSDANVKQIKIFLRDLGEIGATQSGMNDSPSLRGQSLIAERGFITNRRNQQVISGAGLIMSLRAIQDIPPFMNMNLLIVWIDDHLKRQLHEGIDDINYLEDLESVPEARFKQDRYPNGVKQGDVNWANNMDGGYFDRLLAGCMMDSLISQPAEDQNRVIRRPTELAQAIKEFIANPGAPLNYNEMVPVLSEYARRRYDQVLGLWQTPEFEGTILYEWASEKAKDAGYKESQVKGVIEDAGDYLKLVQRWRGSFAAAIGRLRPTGNGWLFERVQE
jgi:hypothetical protein